MWGSMWLADPLFTIAYTGVNAGLIIGVADDPGMHSSQNEQDSRHYAKAAKVPMLEPSDSAEALEFAKLAYEISERFDTPVLLKMCTRVSHSQSIVDTGERVLPQLKPYEKNVAKNVMMPGNAIRRHPIVEQRTRDLIAYAESAPVNRVEMGDTKLGIITSSTSYQYAKEVFGDQASILKLGMIYPLPEQLILDFASKVDRLVVIEELDAVIEEHCRQLGLEVSGKDILPLEGEIFTAAHRAEARRFGAGRKEDRRCHPGASSGHVRRLPAPRHVLYAAQEQGDGHGRHRLLYAGRGGAAERDRCDGVHGRQHHGAAWLQQGAQ